MLVEITNLYFKTASNHMILKVTIFFYNVETELYCVEVKGLNYQTLGLFLKLIKIFSLFLHV